ncbi:hypothetical protein ACFCX4_06370 [Kitasatospora sp. NPDC056327]|uniref:hypothetical protein n=1 Tax=Kitasatospora sp. NPDC056327 TaxID=3345785 RepID=UPI0035D92EB5
MTIRRTALITAAVMLTLSAAAACDDGDTRSAPSAAASSPATASATASASSTPSASSTAEASKPAASPTPTAAPTATGAPVDASGAFDPAIALANADRTPYAATETMKTTATADGQGSVITSTGRVNFNTPTREGRSETRMTLGNSDEPVLWMEVINTGAAVYTRDRTKPGSAWGQTDTDSDDRVDDAAVYAKVLADAGPAARKGMEQKNGIPAYHLASRLTAAQIKTIDPEDYQKMLSKGVDAREYDIWIDRSGRVLAQTMSMKVPRGGTTITSTITVTYTDFGPRETFTAPTTAAS